VETEGGTEYYWKGIKMTHLKNLSVYYKRKGNNYVSGSIVNLPVGNTKVIAKKNPGIDW
jgi:hypothetical protein